MATFSTTTASGHVGLLDDDGIVVDLTAAKDGPATAVDLLSLPDWQTRAAALRVLGPRHPLDEVTLHAPIPAPPKYLAIGMNSREHRKDINIRWLLREPHLIRIAAGYMLAHPRPRHPFFFAKATSSIIGPTDTVVLPLRGDQVDWEGELGVVVGATIHDVSAAEARRAIAGYLIANDVSVRDWQTDNPTAAALAKGYPTHGPLGPWLTTPDAFDESSAQLRTYLNGRLTQQGRIADLILSPAEIISRLSQFCVLRPGDVIACGTFGGTGWPTGRFLKPGDQVRIEIDGLGELCNPVSAYSAQVLARQSVALVAAR
ncbi:fumarylacetoacetate hydrolase family protein [Mycobacterium vicinigordonae]|uniref:Fumarylacetoacetate hydrolase family protein n=1 Tax=Mycobacterium vicinigordonae TaxID=1719132 RepID=A0A7D6HLK3_9MYCO|nr:fumarylacetoacetate hydrolase family protein [Mycobacterium vicinigordonae]QLL05331.1 fumarylacetoacetate hydrolase family protein [Mycobacterium vicinigordonae]